LRVACTSTIRFCVILYDSERASAGLYDPVGEVGTSLQQSSARPVISPTLHCLASCQMNHQRPCILACMHSYGGMNACNVVWMGDVNAAIKPFGQAEAEGQREGQRQTGREHSCCCWPPSICSATAIGDGTRLSCSLYHCIKDVVCVGSTGPLMGGSERVERCTSRAELGLRQSLRQSLREWGFHSQHRLISHLHLHTYIAKHD